MTHVLRRRSRSVAGRRGVATGSGLAVLLATFIMGLGAQGSPAQADPGNPGVPSTPTTVFHEDFENVPGSTNAAQIISDYTSSGGTTYTASPSWLDTANCNGIVANARTTAPLSCASGTYAGFGATLMEAMGIENGASDAKSNYGLLEITAGQNNASDQIQLQTENGITTSQSLSGRFVSFGITAAATTCTRAQPVLTFTLLNDGTELPTGNTGVNPCSDARGHVSSVTTPGGGAIRVGSYFSSGSTLVGDAGELGFIVRNVNPAGSGNDLAFDDITIVDATPQLDKEFVDDGAVAGQPTRLRFTVTNTSDLAQKNGWSFSDALPDGMVVAGTPDASTTCAGGDITAVAGSTSVSVAHGNIATGVASCTVTLDVVADAAGEFSNGPSNVTTTGLNPPGTSTITVAPAAPKLAIKKTATSADPNDSGLTDAGDTISYTFRVTNNGNVPLTGIAVVDPLAGAVTCEDTTLAPGDATDCAADEPYVVDEADEAAGEVVNTAKATGRDPDDGLVESPNDSTRTETDVPNPELTLEKTAGDPVDVNDNGLADAGDTIAYTFRVTNDGNVPVSGIAVIDPLAGAVTCDDTTLDPDDSTDCTADDTYTITASDVEDGTVANTAHATGQDPDDDPVESDPDSTNTSVAAQAPSLTIDKADALVDEDGDGLADVGEEIRYTFTVANTGNVALHDVVVDDPLAGDVTCSPTDLAVGGSATCEADEAYEVTQADVDAGSVDNVATATGTPPAGGDPATSPKDSTSTRTDTRQALSLEKDSQLRDRDGDDLADAGEHITYTFTVTNTGTTTVTDVAVDDAMLKDAGVTVECPSTTLAPGDDVVCTADYEVTGDDVRDGDTLRNVASASGTGVDGPVTSPDDSTQTKVDGSGAAPDNDPLPDTGGPSLLLLLLGVGLTAAGLIMVRPRPTGKRRA